MIRTGGANGRPKQAVILAGGRGTRLAPLTDTMPKAMIRFHGRPFLEYLIEMLREQGFERVLLLLGYLPDQIIEHFGDGKDFGLRIEYQVSPVDDETGTRLRRARPRLDPQFLLLYCDNYWPMDFSCLWATYLAAGCKALVTVYDNEDGYTRDNLLIGGDGRVALYDKARTAPGLKGVDIGFLILDRSILELLPDDGNPSFEAVTYPLLVRNRELAAFVTGHRYYSVGTHARLPSTDAFLARPRMVLLDRDGTLNVRMPPAQYVRSWREWTWLPGALRALTKLTAAGYGIAIVTNQPGIARGALTLADLEAIHQRMIEEASAASARIDAVYYCPHNWDEGCTCRKPKPGLLFRAQKDFNLDLSRTCFIGDDDRDGEAAAAAGARFVKVDDEFRIEAAVASLMAERSDMTTNLTRRQEASTTVHRGPQ